MMRYRQCLCHNFPSAAATPSMLSSRLHLGSTTYQVVSVTGFVFTLATGAFIRHASMPERLVPTR